MSRHLANPLQAVISAATRTTPRITGETANHQQRHDRAGDTLALLADVSTSMAERAGAQTKHQILQDAIASIVQNRHVIAFHSIPVLLQSGAPLPQPTGSTALHLALDFAMALRPRHTIVISDGRPDDETAALAAAGRLSGRIDVIYTGPDDDAVALRFMQALARRGSGQVVVRDLVRGAGRTTLGTEIRRLALTGPS